MSGIQRHLQFKCCGIIPSILSIGNVVPCHFLHLEETFYKIFYVDPDNKTGYHVQAWYSLGISSLGFALDQIPLIGAANKEELNNTADVASILLNHAIQCFNETLDLNPDKLEGLTDEAIGMSIMISNVHFPFKQFDEPCRTGIFIAQDELRKMGKL